MNKCVRPIRKNSSGFTLIELSIVLVIIGLIVGGVLVGQDLIKGAEIRATVSQMEKFTAATNTFRLKYNAIPGDITNQMSTGFGLSGSSGNNNRLIEDPGNPVPLSHSAEMDDFWTHLTDAEMINIEEHEVTFNEACAVAKVGVNACFTVYSDEGMTYYYISDAHNAGFLDNFTNALTPLEAFQIDSKVDDGLPLTGATRAQAGIFGGALDTGVLVGQNDGSSTSCVTTEVPTTSIYTFTATDANCGLRVRAF